MGRSPRRRLLALPGEVNEGESADDGQKTENPELPLGDFGNPEKVSFHFLGKGEIGEALQNENEPQGRQKKFHGFL